MRLICLAALAWLALAPLAWAQGTGATFTTPAGQPAPGEAVLVPCGSIVNGEPVMCPPGPTNGLSVTCTNCSPSAPIGASSNPVSGAIATTNTFQALVAQNSGRKACVFQNTGAHTEYFSVQASPTLAGSLQLPPGAFFECASPGSNVAITDEIWIAGTAGDTFAGNWQ